MKQAGHAESKYCVIIPAYNESRRIEEVVKRACEFSELVVVVDDGSKDDTAGHAEAAGAIVVKHQVNLGKGASLVTGFTYAREHHCDAVITMDADGQHDPAEISLFMDAYKRTRIPVLVGNRLWARGNMPIIRRWTNCLMSWLLSRIMKRYLPDTQCGFRLYRCDILSFVHTGAQRFAMESEILLHLALRGFRMDSVRITTIYRGEKSRINPLMDTFRFFMMLVNFYHDRKMLRQG